MLRAGIVGLPNVGKSTLFNAITASSLAEAANFPFCTIEPNVGIVTVPDERLYVLQKIVATNTVIPTVIEFVDIAGLVAGASQGEGLGNKFLGHIREVDAIIHVVRAFEDPNVIHVGGVVNPISDIETINTELALADLESIDKRIFKVEKEAKSGKQDSKAELELLNKLSTTLNEFIPLYTLNFNEEERQILQTLNLLTSKPVIFAVNMGEDELANLDINPHFRIIEQYAQSHQATAVPISVKIEADLVNLTTEEKIEYLDAMGVKESGVQQMIKSAYKLLNLITFLTAGKKEVKAWTITKGDKAIKAAGKIHTDIERGFIRAEIISYDDYVQCNGEAGAKEKGVLRLEGKEYVMQDGDVVHFRFNV